MAYFRKRGDKWSFTVDVGRDPVTNKRKQVTRSGFESEAKARIACEQFLAELEQGKVPGRIKLETFATEYFEKELIHKLAEGTYINQWQVARDYIFPKLGHMWLDMIRHEHIVHFYNQLLNDGISRATIRNTSAVLKRILKAAVIYGHILRNPAQYATPPKYEPARMKVWTMEEMKQFLESTKDAPLYPVYILALTSGMRRGEILALNKGDLNFETNTVTVTKTLKRTAKSGLHVSSRPKTDNSFRSIILPQNTMDVLRNHIDTKMVDVDILFDKEGKYIYPENVSRTFKSDVRKAGVTDIRFHDMRHTHASHLLQKYSVKVVAERLGDTELTVLQTYAHVLPGMQEQVADHLDTWF